MASGSKSSAESDSGGLHMQGLDVAAGVLETIVSLAAESVAGVACVESSGIAGLVQKAGRTRPVEATVNDDGAFVVNVRLTVDYGIPLQVVAVEVQRAVADALVSQTGREVASVDVWIDRIAFPVG